MIQGQQQFDDLFSNLIDEKDQLSLMHSKTMALNDNSNSGTSINEPTFGSGHS